MQSQPKGAGVFKVSLLTATMAAVPAAHAGTSLEDILMKKGFITKEEWMEIKADEEQKIDLDKKKVEQEVEKRVEAKVAEKIETEFPVKADWGDKGFRLSTRDGNWQTNLQWRAQMRFTNPYRSDPRRLSSFDDEESTFELRRVRMKIGGHGFAPWLGYYFEVDLQPTRDVDGGSSDTRLIDWRITADKYKWIAARVGQWKIDFNRERVDSSGRQQFVERSIVNRVFTLDRQMGAQLRGHLFPGTMADSRYYVGAFTGEGRGTANDDDNFMYMGRVQWNFLGRDLKWRQTDVEFTEQPTGSLAFAAATNIGRCTRWSSSGCGNLDGFASPSAAEDGQFKIFQMVQEAAFKWRGFSLQEEYHWKTVEDRVNDTTSHLNGAYVQAGYFFHNLFPVVPKPLEVAFRYAFVDEPNRDNIAFENTREEFTGALNWFIAGHNNKFTLDVSHLTLDDGLVGQETSDQRVRAQWDISF